MKSDSLLIQRSQHNWKMNIGDGKVASQLIQGSINHLFARNYHQVDHNFLFQQQFSGYAR